MKTLSSKFVYQNPIFSMYTDELEFDDKTVSSRTYLKHPGSVANLVIDDNNNVLLIKQYRHPLGKEMVELPAGIIDNSDKTPRDAAIRELQEETGLKAYY
jgi:ADP-ribose pyrophosphatase